MTTTPSVLRVLSSDNSIRRILMVLLAFVMTHLISYQKLPFTSSYHFPIIPFSIFVFYGIFICEVNTRNYKQLSAKFGFCFDLTSIRRILKINLFTCTIIFTVLTIMQMVIFQGTMGPFRFVGLLSICLMITVIETGVFIVLAFVRKKSRGPVTLNKLASEKRELTILRNNELITFKEEDVAYFIHQNGCIFLVDHGGHRFTTQFESLGEAETRLSSQFFRATRQALVSRQAIRSLKRDVNNKLKLQIDNLNEPLIVSRYKSKELKDWYKG